MTFKTEGWVNYEEYIALVPEGMNEKAAFFNKYGYYPFAKQWEIHQDTHRGLMIVGGERASKSWVAAHEAAFRIFTEWRAALLSGDRMPEYWLIGNSYTLTKPEFEYLGMIFDKLGLVDFQSKVVDPGKMFIGLKNSKEFKGRDCAKIYTKSAEDPRTLAGYAPHGEIGCEFSQVDNETFLRSDGRLSEKRGWMVMSGSFEGSVGWWADASKRWQSENIEGYKAYKFPSWENPIIYPGGRNDPEILRLESSMPKERFMERHGAEPCTPVGTVMEGYFSNSIHVSIDKTYFDHDSEVFIAIDPGFAHACAIEAIQIREGKVLVIDEIYEMGLVTEDMITLFQKKDWAKNVKTGAIDQAGFQHRPEGSPVAEVWDKLTKISLNSNPYNTRDFKLKDGVDVLKTYMKVNPVTNEPGIYVNPQCKGVLSEWGGCVNPITKRPDVWKYHVDIKTGIVRGDEPRKVHDDASKALMYWIVEYFGYGKAAKKRAGQYRSFTTLTR